MGQTTKDKVRNTNATPYVSIFMFSPARELLSTCLTVASTSSQSSVLTGVICTPK